jgi:3-oxoacyl-[acyl-carrier protein] reductase
LYYRIIDRMSTVIVGATGGIGAAVARRLDDDAFVLSYHDREAAAADLAADLDAEATPLALDVTDADSVDEFFRAAAGALPAVDAVVVAHGIVEPSLVEETTDGAFERVLDTNLTGSFRVARAAAPHLRAAGGTLVFLSSVGGTAGTVDASYAASKAGLHGLTRALARELGPDDVQVNAVAPGPVETGMNDAIVEYLESTGFHGHGDVDTHLPAYACSPAEVAEAVAYLVESGYTHGEVLEVDGGMHFG